MERLSRENQLPASAEDGWLVGTGEPRPPFQLSDVEMIYLEGRLDPEFSRRYLPQGFAPSASHGAMLAVCRVGKGWGMAPNSSCYLRIALEGRDSPDGSAATFYLDQAQSPNAAALTARYYHGNCAVAESSIHKDSQGIIARGSLSGRGSVRVSARRTGAPVTLMSGAHLEYAPHGQGVAEFTTAWSTSIEDLVLETLDFDLPRNHRLSGLQHAFTPVGISRLFDKSYALGVPSHLSASQGASLVAPALIDLVERLDLPVLVFLLDGTLSYVSTSARGFPVQALARSFPRHGLASGLSVQGTAIAVPVPGEEALLMRILPLPAALWGQAAALCVVTGTGQPLQAEAVRILTLFGLTQAESRLAVQAASGLSSPSIASKMGLSPHTVRSALKAIYGKLGVHSRAELAALVTRFAG